MSWQCEQNISRSNCCHATLIDNEEGFLACIKCGTCYPHISNRHSLKPLDYSSSLSSDSNVQDICFNNCLRFTLGLNVSSIKNHIFQILRPKTYQDKISIISFAFYVTFLLWKVPRIPQEVTKMTGAPKRSISKILASLLKLSSLHPSLQKYIEICSVSIDASLLTNRYCSLLEISYKHMKKIQIIVSHQSFFHQSSLKP